MALSDAIGRLLHKYLFVASCVFFSAVAAAAAETKDDGSISPVPLVENSGLHDLNQHVDARENIEHQSDRYHVEIHAKGQSAITESTHASKRKMMMRSHRAIDADASLLDFTHTEMVEASHELQHGSSTAASSHDAQAVFSNASDDSGPSLPWRRAVVVPDNKNYHYDHSLWKGSCPSGADTSDGVTKFYCAKAQKIRLKMSSGSWSKTLEYNAGGSKSVKSLFTGSYTKTTYGKSEWRAMGNNKCWQNHCNEEGFNVVTGGKKCRWGMNMNQENDCKTPDSSIGIACVDLGAGIKITCCANEGKSDCLKNYKAEIDITLPANDYVCKSSVCGSHQKLRDDRADSTGFTCQGKTCAANECCKNKAQCSDVDKCTHAKKTAKANLPSPFYCKEDQCTETECCDELPTCGEYDTDSLCTGGKETDTDLSSQICMALACTVPECCKDKPCSMLTDSQCSERSTDCEWHASASSCSTDCGKASNENECGAHGNTKCMWDGTSCNKKECSSLDSTHCATRSDCTYNSDNQDCSFSCTAADDQSACTGGGAKCHWDSGASTCGDATCTTPSTTGYDFTGEGGTKTIHGFDPTGVTCADGFTGTVTYAVCTSANADYVVDGCTAVAKDAAYLQRGSPFLVHLLIGVLSIIGFAKI